MVELLLLLLLLIEIPIYILILILPAGNKADLDVNDKRKVEYNTAHQYALENNMIFQETSAKVSTR